MTGSMPHPAVSSPRPLVYAHRGGAALAPENTIAAFDLGIDWGADGLELDVRLSRDGVVIVHHDATLERTTDAVGPVAARTADELTRVDAGARFVRDQDFPFRGAGLGVPSLDDVLARYPAARLIVELKENTAAMARAVVEAIRRARAFDRVIVGSFGERVLRAVRRADAAIATGASRGEVRWAHYRVCLGWPAARAPFQAFQVPEQSGRTVIVTPRFVAGAERCGAAVQVWTVDDPDDMRRLLDWGVRGLITDRPDVAVEVVRGWRPRAGTGRVNP